MLKCLCSLLLLSRVCRDGLSYFGSKAVVDTYVVQVLHLHLNLEREIVSVCL